MAKPGWPNGGWPSAGGPASEDFLVTARRIAAVRPVGWPHNLQASRGQGPSPVRARTARRPAKFLACCVRRAADDGQAAHGRPGQQRPIRPLAASLASSCPISSPWPAAAGGGSGRMGRPSARRPSSCDQCGSTAATEPRRGRAGALVDGNGRRAGRSRARRAGAGAIRRLPRCAAPRHTSSIGTPTGTARVRPCLAAAHRRRPSLRRWLAGERSASGREARQVRGGTACLCCVSGRVCSRVSLIER